MECTNVLAAAKFKYVMLTHTSLMLIYYMLHNNDPAATLNKELCRQC